MSEPHYAELHCLSCFSFLRAASHPEELAERAAALGYDALAITDECSLAGIVRAHLAARDHALKLLVGSEFRLDALCLVLLCTDRTGYAQLSALITRARRRAGKGQYIVSLEDFLDELDHCLLIVLPSPARSGTEAPPADDATATARSSGRGFNPVRTAGLSPSGTEVPPEDTLITTLRDAFPGRIWLGLELHLHDEDSAQLQKLQALSQHHGIPLAACSGACMHDAARQSLLDVMHAIRLGSTVQQLGLELEHNSERHLRTRHQLARRYPQALLDETLHVAGRCNFSLDELRYEYPPELVPDGHTPSSYLRLLTETGQRRRWPGGPDQKVLMLIRRELELIEELRYEHYFITVYDIVRFARARNILCQGRGSAANSAVCFCLGITEVDPSRAELLFERFISKERAEPPDIDVDFEHERREEVIQYIYGKYGRERAALAATVITYRAKSAVRDVGKALGMDLDLVEQLARNLIWWDKPGQFAERLQGAGLSMATPVARHFLRLVREILGFPRHLSQHVGGFLISAGPIHELVPVENAAMTGRTVIQWDKDDIDALGLLKIDVLALGMLTAIRKSLQLIHEHHGLPIGVGDIPAEDPAVYELIQRADTVGVFQIESRAQMSMLPRLKPRCFYDLVIEVSIVRPGPIQGDMVHPYLRRRDGLEPVTYANDEIRAVLERTLGVPLFQEQVIRLAMVAAGFSAGEADQLRRAMAAWKRKGGLHPFRDRLINGMLERGHDPAFAERVFSQIQGFGEYGFPESHAASFALLVYVSAWIKCHYPAAFYCGLLNSLPMGFYSPSQLVQDARRHAIEVRAIDVCYSRWDHSLEAPAQHGAQPALRLGLRLVRGLSRNCAERMLEARGTGVFRDIDDLATRAEADRRSLQALADADAFRSLAGHRHLARWQVHGLEPPRPLLSPQTTPPEPQARLPAPGVAEDLFADYHSCGLTLGPHPLALLREHPRIQRCAKAAHLSQLQSGQLVRVAGLVVGRQRPGTASGVVFLTLEDDTGSVNVVVWGRSFEAQRAAIIESRLLHVTGTLETRDGVTHVIAGRLEDFSDLLAELDIRSRDFR